MQGNLAEKARYEREVSGREAYNQDREEQMNGKRKNPTHCWKCGTPCLDEPGIGLFCPKRDCEVVDSVGLSPEEFEARAKEYGGYECQPSRPLTAEEEAESRDAIMEAHRNGQTLLVKVLRDD